MNLIRYFQELLNNPFPTGDTFASKTMENYPCFRIAISSVGLPVLLLQMEPGHGNLPFRNFRLRHLSIEHLVKCRVNDESGTTEERFSIIRFLSGEPGLQEFFLNTAEQLIRNIGPHSEPGKLLEELDRFAELFRAMSAVPKKTIQGLWAELFLIERCRDSALLLDHWHERPEEKFDFNAGAHKLEVKSFSGLERIHHFSAEQLNPQAGHEVLIASVYLRSSSLGVSILELCTRIVGKLAAYPRLIDKLYLTISSTLGSELQHANEVRYDYTDAKSGIKLFHYSQIPRIMLSDLSAGVSEVRFKSDLSAIGEWKIVDSAVKPLLFTELSTSLSQK